MKYDIHAMGHRSEDLDELADFLADFVRRGELAGAPQEDTNPALWRKRMRWWWEMNPFCRDDSPTGFTLRTPDGELVGFHGLIPYDYESGKNPVPGLISSTFCIRPEHRAGSMAVFLRVHRLTKNFHLVDGGPTEAAIQILSRFGYQRGKRRSFYFYLCGPKIRKRRLTPGLKFTTDPSEVTSVPRQADGNLRKKVTKESLQWLAKIGSRPRLFLGACDADGNLVAYALGIYKNLPGGFLRCQIIDYASYDESRCEVFQLLEYAAARKNSVPLRKGTIALIWGLENGANHPPLRLSLKRDSKVFFAGPNGLETNQKIVLPSEGDFSYF